jgi:hypothetical protein
MKFDLPSGAWADLLTPDKLKAKHHRLAMRAVTQVENKRQGAMAIDMLDGVLAVVIQDWSVTYEKTNEETGAVTIEPLPVPSVDFDSIDELEIEDYEALLGHPFVKQIAQRLQELRAERVSPDDWNDPASPSEPSSGSGPAPRAAASLKAGTSAPSGTSKRSTSGSRSAGAGRRKS